jgi:hypothetical protein
MGPWTHEPIVWAQGPMGPWAKICAHGSMGPKYGPMGPWAENMGPGAIGPGDHGPVGLWALMPLCSETEGLQGLSSMGF